jgi:hypothetical protein
VSLGLLGGLPARGVQFVAHPFRRRGHVGDPVLQLGVPVDGNRHAQASGDEARGEDRNGGAADALLQLVAGVRVSRLPDLLQSRDQRVRRGAALDERWPGYILTVLVRHWVYGLHLALVYNPLPTLEGNVEAGVRKAPPADGGRDEPPVLSEATDAR